MPSFDIVSRIDLAEVDNAVAGIDREIATRFDFKGSKCAVERKEGEIELVADDELKLKQMHELLKVHLTRRKVEPAALEYKKPEKASGNTLRQSDRCCARGSTPTSPGSWSARSRTASSRCRRRSRAASCGSPAKSATICRPRSRCPRPQDRAAAAIPQFPRMSRLACDPEAAQLPRSPVRGGPARRFPRRLNRSARPAISDAAAGPAARVPFV